VQQHVRPERDRSWIAVADLISAALALMRLLGWQAVARRTRYRRGIARLVFSVCSSARGRPARERSPRSCAARHPDGLPLNPHPRHRPPSMPNIGARRTPPRAMSLSARSFGRGALGGGQDYSRAGAPLGAAGCEGRRAVFHSL
jgi:hypothetical protein